MNAVFCIFCRIIVRADHDIGRTLATIRAGKSEAKNWALPEVEHATGSLPRRIVDLDSSVFQIAEIEDVRSSQVCGDDAPLFLQRLKNDKVSRTLNTIGFALIIAPCRDANERRAPDIGLGRTLIIHLVVKAL
jgi:hypothetical protein